jgi:hypothetical protein
VPNALTRYTPPMIGARLAGALGVALLGAAVVVGCSDDGGGGGGDSEATEDVDAFCDRIDSVQELRADFSNFDPTKPDEAVDSLRSGATTFDGLRGVAPAELEDDIDTMVDVLERLADAIEELDEPDPAAVFAVVGEFDDDLVEAEEAADRVAAFTRDRCDIDLDAGETEPEPDETTTTEAEDTTTTTESDASTTTTG